MRRIQLSLRKKLIFATITTLLFLVSLEVLLALVGVRPESQLEDRTVGFSNYLPLFVAAQNEQGEAILTTAENKLHWFNRQSFPKLKAAGTKRIFCMGGSTTYGHPYWDETSFAGWLREYLPQADATHSWEVINAGGISYGSYRVAALMEELAQYQPDLFIIYSAHNEFLERHTYSNLFDRPAAAHNLTALLSRSRIWTVADNLVRSPSASKTKSPLPNSLPAEVDEQLNHTPGPIDYHRDAQWHDTVITQYAVNLQRMIDIARRCRAEIVFVHPAANEKDCAPFKSELSTADSKLAESVHSHLDAAKRAFEQSQYSTAADESRQATEIDPAYAHAHYWLGRAWLANGQSAEAKSEFQRALDEDVCPLRAITPLQERLRQVALKNSVPVVDFQSRLREVARAQTGAPILGNEYFLDHVHPTIEVNRQLSLWVMEELMRTSWLPTQSLTDPAIQRAFDEIRERVLASIDIEDEIFAIRNLAKVYHWAGKFEEAVPLARDVLELAPNDPESRSIIASCLANLGRRDQALEEYERLFADGIGYPRAYLPYGELLLSAGHYESAKAYLLLAILRSPDNPRLIFH